MRRERAKHDIAHGEDEARTPSPPAGANGRFSARATELMVSLVTLIAREPEPDRMIDALLAMTIDLLGARVSHLCELAAHDDALRLVGERGLPAPIAARLARVTMTERLVEARAARTRRLAIVTGLDGVEPLPSPEMALTRELLAQLRCRTSVAIPLVVTGATTRIMVLSMAFAEPLASTDADCALLAAFGKLAAVGLSEALVRHPPSLLGDGRDEPTVGEAGLGMTIEEAPIGMAMLGLDGRFLRVNRALCAMVGYAKDELVRLRFQDITHREDLASGLEAVASLLSGAVARCEMPKRYIRKNGSVVDAVLHVSLARDAHGTPLHFVAQIVDVSERRRAERDRELLTAALAEERSWLRAVIDRSPVGIVLLEGVDRPRVRANQRVTELLGHPLAGSSLPFVTLGGRRLEERESPAARALRGEIAHREELMLGNGGPHVPLVVSAAPIRDAARRVLGAVMVMEDVSAEKELERLRGEWISVIAHDLRRPVASIAAHAQLLGRTAATGGEHVGARASADHVLASVHRLDRMIGDLVDMSRLEANRLELHLRPTDVTKLVREIVDRMAGQIVDRAVQVCVRGPIPAVLTDSLRYEQVLGNLLSNAVKYGDPGTEVTIELVTDGDLVQTTVANRGAGIPKSELTAVFERFRRSRSVRRGGSAGLGLGLYISHGLVEANGGRIWVESQPFATTAFRFALPIARGAEMSRPPSPRESIH